MIDLIGRRRTAAALVLLALAASTACGRAP
jgi:hypothetical protein